MDDISLEHILEQMLPLREYMASDHLLKSLPNLYREKDKDTDPNESDHLKKYLSGFGFVLDQLRNTLDQRLRDISPITCQPWLLPYFADLLDVELISPDPFGQRQEIANAIEWRQRKGTLSVCEEIAEAVGQAPIIAYEGFKSMARTPTTGERQKSLRELGELGYWDDRSELPRTATELSRRPGTQAVTLDFRKISQPRLVSESLPTPGFQVSRFNNEEIFWQRENAPYGLPCHRQEGYRHVNVHTADFRKPNDKQGHHHPRRVRLYTPVPEGFVKTETQSIPAEYANLKPLEAPEVDDPNWCSQQGYRYLVRKQKMGGQYYLIEERRLPQGAPGNNNNSAKLHTRLSLLSLPGYIDNTLREEWYQTANWQFNRRLFNKITDYIPPEESASTSTVIHNNTVDLDKWDSHWHYNAFLLQVERFFDSNKQQWQTKISGGNWNRDLRRPGVAGKAIPERSHLQYPRQWPNLDHLKITQAPNLGLAETQHLRIQQLLIQHTKGLIVDELELEQTAIQSLECLRSDGTLARLSAKNSLIVELKGNAEAESAERVDLEYCTLVKAFSCQHLRASDCILLGELSTSHIPKLQIRFSCVPLLNRHGSDDANWQIHRPSVHQRWPEMYQQKHAGAVDGRTLTAGDFGKPGFAILKQSCHHSIRNGAEDGGELGAFHHRRYCSRQDAIIKKMQYFLPVGTLAALIVDENWTLPQPETPKVFPEVEGFIADEGNTIPDSISTEFMRTQQAPSDSARWIRAPYKGENKNYLVRKFRIQTNTDENYFVIEERLRPTKSAKTSNSLKELRIRSTLLTLPESISPPTLENWINLCGWQGNDYLVQSIGGSLPITGKPEKNLNLDLWTKHWGSGNGYLLQWERYLDNKDEWQTVIRGGTWNLQEQAPGPVRTKVDHSSFPPSSTRFPATSSNLQIEAPEFLRDSFHKVEINELTLAGEVKVEATNISLNKVAAKNLQIMPSTKKQVIFSARDCLIYKIDSNPNAKITLDYCTVLKPFYCKELLVKNSIILGELSKKNAPKASVHYSCIPQLKILRPKFKNNILFKFSSRTTLCKYLPFNCKRKQRNVIKALAKQKWPAHHSYIINELPSFYRPPKDINFPVPDEESFGLPSFGVLNSKHNEKIFQGSEDGGELGAFNHLSNLKKGKSLQIKPLLKPE